jgi:hypothetical protein
MGELSEGSSGAIGETTEDGRRKEMEGKYDQKI